MVQAQDAVRQHFIALKVKHRIHDMLHDFGACNGTVLVHMPHNEHGDLLLFGHGQQAGRTFLDLTYCTGGGRDIHAAHRLDGVDDHEIRLFFFDQAADLVHIILRCQKDVILRHF